MNNFSTRFIITSILVVIGGFLTIYLLFNGVANRFVANIGDEFLTVRIHNNNAENAAVFSGEWNAMPLSEVRPSFLASTIDITPSESLPLAILTDTFTHNYVMFNERGMIISSYNLTSMNAERVGDVDLRFFLVDYFRANQNRFAEGVSVEVVTNEQIFHVRSVAVDQLGENEFPMPAIPINILFFTEVTEIITFRQSVNQILLTTLFFVAGAIITTTILMSIRLNSAVKHLANYASNLGHGKFDTKTPSLKYTEFQTLSKSMADMANMLAVYETNQKQFFQNASHELRTPLMSIQCYSEGILADVFTPTDAANIIDDEVKKMTELVNSILYLSRIDHHDFQFAPVNTNEFVQTCYKQIKILIENNKKTIIFTKLAEDVPIFVDAALLERAILNILTNALRYTQNIIEIKVESYLERNIFANIKQNMVRIVIFNDGIHIADQDLPYIFDRFYKGAGGNTGIGLAITREIIHAFNGTIVAENVKNGVQFIINLPILEKS